MTRTEDRKNVQIGMATSVVLHLLLLLLLGWLMRLDQTAQAFLQKARQAVEEPKVTLLFPEQVMPTPKLKPKLDTKNYIRTTQNEEAAEKPVKSDFISDRNTKAAAKEAPFPDATKAMPSLKGIDLPTLEMVNRKVNDGEIADDNARKAKDKSKEEEVPKAIPVTAPPPPLPAAAPTAPMLSQIAPQEPKTLPLPPSKEVAKADQNPMAKMMEQLDKAEVTLDTAKLPLEVRKPTPPIPSKESPPAVPTPAPSAAQTPQVKPPKDTFSPFTETARTKGTISNRGEAAVDAEATPMGKFMRAVTSAVEKKWHLLRLQNRGDVSYGYLKVRFFVNREGRPEDIKFVEKADNPQMEDFTLEAILKAQIPPIPRELLPMLDDERFPVEYDIIIHD